MTRRHFELLAQAIREAREYADSDSHPSTDGVLDYLSGWLAGRLRSENPRFDTRRFLTAAGCTLPTVDRLSD